MDSRQCVSDNVVFSGYVLDICGKLTDVVKMSQLTRRSFFVFLLESKSDWLVGNAEQVSEPVPNTGSLRTENRFFFILEPDLT